MTGTSNEAGIHDPKRIDLITLDSKNNEVVLIMVERRPWGTSADQLLELQAKINSYLAFALDGEMRKKLPESVGRSIRIQLDTESEPDADTWHFIDVVKEKLQEEGVRFTVNLI